jgi:hypothetical protein
MAANEHDDLQRSQLDDDVVAELEAIARRLNVTEGNVTIEAVFSNGLYTRGFVHRGPLAREELRALGRST